MATTRALRILILDDNPADADVLRNTLTEAGFEFVAIRVETEIDFTKQLSTYPDLILADYSLPQFNALQALQLLRDRAPDIPFIVVTDTVSEETAVACIKQGAADYLLKDRLTRLGQAVVKALENKDLRIKQRSAAKELTASEVRYRRLFEAAQDGILILNIITGQVLDANPFLLDLLGYSLEEFRGKELWEIGLFKDIASSQASFRELQDKGYIRYDDMPLVTRAGRRIQVEFVSNVYLTNDEKVIQCNIRDISERNQAKDRIRKLNRTLAVQSGVNQSIVRIRHLPTLFDKICEIAVEKGAFRMAWIGLLDIQTRQTNLVAHGGMSDDYFENLNTAIKDYQRGHDPFYGVMKTGQRVVYNDIENDPQMQAWRDESLRLGYRALAVLPLTIFGEVRGIINLYANEPHFFDDDELKLLDEMAMDVSFAMEVAEQDEKRQRAEAAVNRYAQRMEILHQIDTGIINARSIQEVVDTALKHIRTFFVCQQAAAVQFDFTTNEVIIFALDLNATSAFSKGTRYSIPPNFLEGYGTNTVTVINDIQMLREPSPTYIQLIKEGMRSSLRALFMAQGRPIGLLSLSADTPGYFTPEHQEIAAEIADQLAIAIHQLQLSEALAQHAVELEHKVAGRTADLSDAKERVEAILNNASDGILLVHSDLKIQQTNSSFNFLFGCEQDAYFGKSLVTLVHDDDADVVTNIVHLVGAEPQRKHIEIRARREDGEVFDAEFSISDIKGNGLVCTIRDITERKVKDRQLRYQASLQETVSDAVIVTDIAFRVQSWNRAAERIYGWSADEIIGKATGEILHTEYSAKEDLVSAVRQLHEQNWWQGEVIQYHKDGSVRYILESVTLVKSENGGPFSVLSVNRDITERRLAEEALREQRDFLEQVIKNTAGPITVNDASGRVQLANEVAARLLGMTTMDIVGKTNYDFGLSQAEIDLIVETDRQALATGQAVFISEQKILGRYYQTSKIPLKNRVGVYDRLLSMSTDISERKQAEEALRQALEKEKELNELKSRFVSMASHEFRTPLASILAATETLSIYRHKLTDEQIEQRLGKIRTQVGHLKDIMDDVLLLARMQARRVDFNPVRLNLDDLCRSILDEFQSQADVTQPIEYTCNTEDWPVTLDEKLMRQIINNLVSNAIKYSLPDKPIKVSLEFASNQLALRISDQGIGIPEADLKYLFEPFHRASNVGVISGTGLGLVITKESVEMHGGTIDVESQIGNGTTFTVTFPLPDERGLAHDNNPDN